LSTFFFKPCKGNTFHFILGEKESILEVLRVMRAEKDKLEAMRQALRAEEDHWFLRKTYHELGCDTSLNGVTKYVCDMIKEEMPFIIPQETVVSFLSDANKLSYSFDDLGILLQRNYTNQGEV